MTTLHLIGLFAGLVGLLSIAYTLRALRLAKGPAPETESTPENTSTFPSLSIDGFRFLFEATNDIVLSLDLNGVILSASPSTARVLGLGWREYVGKPAGSLIGVSTAAEWDNLRDRLLRGNSSADSFYDFASPDGKSLSLRARMKLFGDLSEDEPGEIVAVIQVDPGRAISSTVSDTTHGQLGRLDRALDLARTNEAVETHESALDENERSQILAQITHELRTPLTGIIGVTSALKESDLSREQRELAELAYNCSETLLSVVNGFLDFSKLEAGLPDDPAESMRIDDIVEEIAEIISIRAHGKGLELVTVIDPEVPLAMSGNPLRLRQVLFNLAGNAVKFTESGQVTIHVSLCENGHDKSAVCFEIRDTGVGIAPNELSHIFEPYVQLSNAGKTPGSGLGLAIAKRLIQSMGGRIDVTSELFQGSKFQFSLPLNCVDRRAECVERHVTFDVPCLCVSPNVWQYHALRSRLQRLGCSCDHAHSWEEAVVRTAQKSHTGNGYKLILLDECICESASIENLHQLLTSPSRTCHAAVMRRICSPRSAWLDKLFATELDSINLPVRFDQIEKLVTKAGMHVKPRPEPLPSTLTTAAVEAAQTLRILLAEDDEVNQFVSERMLRRMGHDVHVVVNGREAIEAWQDREYDLLLLDLEMPEVNGYEVALAIRELEALSGRRTPMVALSAYGDPEAEQLCLKSGMDAFLSKPVRPVDLQAVIAKIACSQTS